MVMMTGYINLKYICNFQAMMAFQSKLSTMQLRLSVVTRVEDFKVSIRQRILSRILTKHVQQNVSVCKSSFLSHETDNLFLYLQAIRADVETAEELLSALQAAASEVAANSASRSTLEVDAETQSAVAALNDLTRTLAEAETKMAAEAELRLVTTPQSHICHFEIPAQVSQLHKTQICWKQDLPYYENFCLSRVHGDKFEHLNSRLS